MRLTQAESERNRKQILEVAGRLFRQRGFDGVGVDDLMKAAGFTHGGFYNHFGSKAELEAEASAAGTAQAKAALAESLSDPRKDGWEDSSAAIFPWSTAANRRPGARWERWRQTPPAKDPRCRRASQRPSREWLLPWRITSRASHRGASGPSPAASARCRC